MDAVGDLLHHENWDRRLCDSSCPIDFCRFIGMLASYGVLFFYLWKEGKLKSLFGKQAVHPDINPTAIVIETFKEAVPFIITGSAIQLFPTD